LLERLEESLSGPLSEEFETKPRFAATEELMLAQCRDASLRASSELEAGTHY